MPDLPSSSPRVDHFAFLRKAAAAANRLLLQAIERATPSEQNRLFGLTLLVGAACGLAAVAFHLTLRFAEAQLIDRALRITGPGRYVGLVLTPALGALIAGVALEKLAPDARGSGIPQVKWVYAAKSGRLRLRDGFAKFVLAALQIGTGSSLGREGPTVQICSTVASGLGRLFALSPSNQRRLIPVGAAAGIAAAFNAPIAAVTFVIEELVGSLDTTVLSGVVVAAALSAVVEHSILGEHPILDVPGSYRLAHASSLVVFAALGFGAGGLGGTFTRGLLGVRKWFRTRSSIPSWAQPGVGGLLTGLFAALTLSAVGALGITGGGYDSLGAALRGDLPYRVLAVLCVAKFAATITSYSSGGSGGIFAPSLFVGGMLGGLFGALDHYVLGHGDTQLGAFALVGMGAFFAAVIRAPITSILIIFEMTGSYKLVLPLMVASSAAYITARALSPAPIYDALLEQDGRVIPHAGKVAPALTGFRVRDAMIVDVESVDATDTVDGALARVEASPHASFPVLGPDGRLVGVMTEARLRRLSAEEKGADAIAPHARLREYLRARQSLRDGLATMQRLGLSQMAVVDDVEHQRLVGILAMSDVMRVIFRHERLEEGPSSASTATPLAIQTPRPSS